MKSLTDTINDTTEISSAVSTKAGLIGSFCYSYHLIIILILSLFAASSCKQDLNDSNTSPSFDKKLPRPSWVAKEPLVIVGNWDDIPLFNSRRGGGTVSRNENFYKDYLEETVRKLKDMGVTMAIIPFYKAFGLEAEKENMEYSKKLASLFKQQGLRVGVYIGSTFGYETFLAEDPQAGKWIVPDFMGRPVIYGDQTFRKQVYFQHPGYKAYIKRVLRIAIEDLKADLIHFDNPSVQGSHPVFFHPLAIGNFRAFLQKKYTPEMMKKRLGFSDVRYIEPPAYDRPLRTIDDPLFQEWTDFRCQQLADYYGEMEQYIRGLNPEVAVENNPHGLSGENTMWDASIDFPRLLSHTDFFWTEGEATSLTDDGLLISKIRTFKMARSLNNRVFTYTSNSKLEMAEAMAYNRQGMGMVGDLSAGDRLPEDQKNYIKFFRDHFDSYKDVDNVADVAVLHSFASMAYNNDLPYQSTFLFEQVLIQSKILFDIIFDNHLKNLSKYKVLVLADQECLNDEELDLIRSFVKNGGGLVATGNTSLFTGWRKRKSEFGLKDLFQLNDPAERGKLQAVKIIKSLVGNGRVVYIPSVEPSVPKPPAAGMTSHYWKLPVNWKELMESVLWASGNNLSLSVKAPLSVTMELTQKEDKSALILHLVNYGFKKTDVQNIKVDLQVPEGKKIKQVTFMTPDGINDEILRFNQNGKQIVFNVPYLSVYDMIVMNLE